MTAIKLTEGQKAALETLRDTADSFIANFPAAKDNPKAIAWRTFEPSYCWGSAYGFSVQAMLSLVRRELAGRVGGAGVFYITDAGRAALTAALSKKEA